MEATINEIMDLVDAHKDVQAQRRFGKLPLIRKAIQDKLTQALACKGCDVPRNDTHQVAEPGKYAVPYALQLADGLDCMEHLGCSKAADELRRQYARIEALEMAQGNGQFKQGQRVRKKSGSEWQGRVVGWYSTEMTPEGYAVESETHKGSVQIYPAKALELA